MHFVSLFGVYGLSNFFVILHVCYGLLCLKQSSTLCTTNQGGCLCDSSWMLLSGQIMFYKNVYYECMLFSALITLPHAVSFPNLEKTVVKVLNQMSCFDQSHLGESQRLCP